jgi:hypothetical protein
LPGALAVRADCKKLVCFVYDPEHRLTNPDAVEGDLSGVEDGCDPRRALCYRGRKEGFG